LLPQPLVSRGLGLASGRFCRQKLRYRALHSSRVSARVKKVGCHWVRPFSLRRAELASLLERSKKLVWMSAARGLPWHGAERIQGADVVVPGEPGTMRAPLPEVSRAPEHAVETPGTVSVEPMHEAREIGRLCRFQEIVDMIAHETHGVSLEYVIIFSFSPSSGTGETLFSQRDLPC